MLPTTLSQAVVAPIKSRVASRVVTPHRTLHTLLSHPSRQQSQQPRAFTTTQNAMTPPPPQQRQQLHPPSPSITTMTTTTQQYRHFSARRQFEKRLSQNQEKYSKSFVERQEALGQRGKAMAQQAQEQGAEKHVQHMKKMFPDGQVQPYDPTIVAVRPDAIKTTGAIISPQEAALAKGGGANLPGEVVKKDSMLSKLDKKFGGSLHLGRLNIWQAALITSIIAYAFYASRWYKEKTIKLPQKQMATPMIDFLRTTTLIKYLWTMRLMLEVGAIVPYDGTENLQDIDHEALQADIEASLSEDASKTIANSTREDSHLMKKLKHHPDILRNQNYIQALAVIDGELHELDQELREALIALMEIFADAGRPYYDSYVSNNVIEDPGDPSDPAFQADQLKKGVLVNNTKNVHNNPSNSVDALYLHNTLNVSTTEDPEVCLKHHELMKDMLQVLFTRQNSTHRHYGQMFSDVYALTYLRSGIFALPEQDRKLIPDELQSYIHTVGYDIVRMWQDHYVHELFKKKLGKHLYRLAYPSEIIDYSLVNDQRANFIEPFVRELRRVDPQVIADYNDFLDYHQTISLTDNYKGWWRRMTSNMPRFRRAVDPQPAITISNYTQLFRDYDKIFGKVPYLSMLSKEVHFLERCKDIALGNLVDVDGAAEAIDSMATTKHLHRLKRVSDYSLEAVMDDAQDKLKALLEKDFADKMTAMSYLDEKQEDKMKRDNEKLIEKKLNAMKKHQHTLSLLKIPDTMYTSYLYNLLDISSPMLQVIKDHLDTLNENEIHFPMYPALGSYHGIYQDISRSAQVLCQRDTQLIDLKSQLGRIYRELDPKYEDVRQLSPEMKQRLVQREKELLAIPDVREYALSMTREEIAKDEQFIYGKAAGLFDLDEEKKKLNIFGDVKDDDITANHPINKGERGKIKYTLSIPDPPKHLSHTIWMLDSYVDVRPGRPDYGEDRRAFSAKKFNALRSFMPIPTRYVPQSVKDAIRKEDEEWQAKRNQEKLEKANRLKKQQKDGTNNKGDDTTNHLAIQTMDEDKRDETLTQRQFRKHKNNQKVLQQQYYKHLTFDELQLVEKNKLQRLHALAGANLAKLETCITQDLVELNTHGINIKMPLTGLKPSQFKHLIQAPYSTLEREEVFFDATIKGNNQKYYEQMGRGYVPGAETGLGGIKHNASFLQPVPQQPQQTSQFMTYLVISGKERLLDKYQADLATQVTLAGGAKLNATKTATTKTTTTSPARQNHSQLILQHQGQYAKDSFTGETQFEAKQDLKTTEKALESPTIRDVMDSGLKPSEFYKKHSEEQYLQKQQELEGLTRGQTPARGVIRNDELINLQHVGDDAQIVLPFSSLDPEASAPNSEQVEKKKQEQTQKKTKTTSQQQKQQLQQQPAPKGTLEHAFTQNLTLPVHIPVVLTAEEEMRLQQQKDALPVDPMGYAYQQANQRSTTDQSLVVYDPSAAPVPANTQDRVKAEHAKQLQQQQQILEQMASTRGAYGEAPLNNLHFDRIETMSIKKQRQEQAGAAAVSAAATTNTTTAVVGQNDDIQYDDDDDDDWEYEEDGEEHYTARQPQLEGREQGWGEWVWGGSRSG